MSDISTRLSRILKLRSVLGWRYLFSVLGVTIIIGIFVGLKKDLTISEWAAWVQAIGSIAAILGAIWITSQEDRRRRGELRAAARLTASGLTMRLASISASVRQVKDRFNAWGQMDFDPRELSQYIDILENAAACSPSELISLVPLQNNAAYKLAGAFDRLHASVFALKSFRNSRGANDSEARKQFMSLMGFSLGEACNLFDLAIQVLQNESLSLTSPFHIGPDASIKH